MDKVKRRKRIPEKGTPSPKPYILELTSVYFIEYSTGG
jgi:hypothetical protein